MRSCSEEGLSSLALESQNQHDLRRLSKVDLVDQFLYQVRPVHGSIAMALRGTRLGAIRANVGNSMNRLLADQLRS